MPILGRQGESIGTRLFGKAGIGQGLKNLASGATTISGRIKQGLDNPGGFLGATAHASTGDGLSAAASKFKSDLEASKDSTSFSKNSPMAGDQMQNGGAAPNDINNPAKTGGSSNPSGNSKLAAVIGRGWDDVGDVINDTKKSLSSSKNYISNLGKVKDQYLKSLDTYKANTDAAIAGNKTLIEQNQKKDLDTLAGETRKSIDNTNVMLGVKGASGGSASRAASRAISEKAGKQRAATLTARGDQMSSQNQAEKNALEDYNVKRQQAYEWEAAARQQALDTFNEQKKALDRLDKKKSGWKDADIKAESDKNLNSLLGSLNAIQTQARAFRDGIAAKMSEYGGLSDELETAAVSVDAPAELDTPKFSETIDLQDPNNAEDWYDPNKTGQRVIKGYDALGNPIYDDAALVDEPVTA